MATKKKRRQTRRVRTDLKCKYCVGDKNPDYKDYQDLEKWLSERARIVPSKYSGVCSRHQRKLATAIKRARHLGLLPFAPGL